MADMGGACYGAGMSRTSSLYLDLLRFCAACTVLLGHLGRFLGFSPHAYRFVEELSGQGVTIFFVLSGFVIRHTAEHKDHDAGSYFLSRLTRLYSVIVPALLLTLMADAMGARFDPSVYTPGHDYGGSFPVLRTLISLLFLNQIWFLNIVPFSNGPFWSLAYEFWYYVIFAAFFYLKGARRYWVALILALAVGPKIALMFPLWLLGAGLYWIIPRINLSTRQAYLLLLFSLALYIPFEGLGIYRYLGWRSHLLLGDRILALLGNVTEFIPNYAAGGIIALNIVAISKIGGGPIPAILDRFATQIRAAASVTFSIYLYHRPLTFLAIAMLGRAPPLGIAVPVSLAIFAAVCLLGLVTERRKHVARRALLGLASLGRPLARQRIAGEAVGSSD